MRRMREWTTSLCIAMILTGCGVPTTVGSGDNNAPVNQTVGGAIVGQRAPDFTLQRLDGTGSVALSSLLGQGPVVLNAWASWCGPCQQEMPDMVKVSQAFKGRVQFVGIDMTAEDKLVDAKTFAAKYHVPYLLLADENGAFLDSYKLLGTPTTWILGSDGTILSVHPGPYTTQQLTNALKQALKSSS